ncbi:MAG: MauE/DoxX family redox-associated membrane protein [Pseudomonadota bacterium]
MQALPELATVALRTGLAGLAAAAALHKLRDLGRSRRATRALTGADGLTADVVLGLAITLEAGGAALSLTGAFGSRGQLLLAVVWLLYAGALARQRAGDCGCGFGRRSPSHTYGIVRNIVLAALALATAGWEPHAWRPDLLAAGAPAALVFLLLYLAADELGSHPRLARSRP